MKQHLDIKSGSGQQRRGAKGETRAAIHLVLHGYRILERNYKAGSKEIDIIAKKGKTLVFAEVKSSLGNGLPPMLRVGQKKRANIISAARTYRARNGVRNCYIRYDIIEVDLSKRFPLSGVNHIENAYTE